MTIHVADTISKFIKELKDKGDFKGVRFVELYDETNRKHDLDEQTKEEFDKSLEDYACFVAHPDLYWDDYNSCDSNEYINTITDWGKFQSDFEQELRNRLGDDVIIEHRSPCNEYECIRKEGYSYNKTQEKYILKIDKYPVKMIVNACKNIDDITSEPVIEMAKLLEVSPLDVKNHLMKLSFDVLIKYGQLI